MEPAAQGYSVLFPLIVLAVALWFAWRAWQSTRWPQVPAMVRAVERPDLKSAVLEKRRRARATKVAAPTEEAP